ncbi:hypothetical protein D3C71_1535110 [compost metagenome]
MLKKATELPFAKVRFTAFTDISNFDKLMGMRIQFERFVSPVHINWHTRLEKAISRHDKSAASNTHNRGPFQIAKARHIVRN